MSALLVRIQEPSGALVGNVGEKNIRIYIENGYKTNILFIAVVAGLFLIKRRLRGLPFAASQVILREPRVLGPGACEHLGTLGKIQAEAETKREGRSNVEELQR